MMRVSGDTWPVESALLTCDHPDWWLFR